MDVQPLHPHDCWTSHSKIMTVAMGHKSINDAEHWCLVIWHGSQLMFQFSPKVLEGIKDRALCRPIRFFHNKPPKRILNGPGFVLRGIVMLKQKMAFPILDHIICQLWLIITDTFVLAIISVDNGLRSLIIKFKTLHLCWKKILANILLSDF